MDKEEVISELRRVATDLNSVRLTQNQFKQYGRVSLGAICNKFGSWNQALEAAGLPTAPPGPNAELHQQKISDEDLLQEIIRLTEELGKKPTNSEMNAKGRYSEKPYRKRWGSFTKAREVAYAKYGFPTQRSGVEVSAEQQSLQAQAITETQVMVPQTHKPKESNRRKKVQFGEPIDFRGLRFAPINEQGVVYLFGMISRELGFLIESIRTEYPDCEGKRCIDKRKQRWEHVLIEFEYRSSNFDHSPDDCDLIVCWIHDWEDCPIEVLELRSQIKYLPNR